MSSPKGSGLVGRAVREALGTLVSPQLCEELILRSLEMQGLEDVPESGPIIREWLEGPLRTEIEEMVGGDAADLVIMQLSPIAAYASIAQPRAPAAPAKPQPAPAKPQPAQRAPAPAPQRGPAPAPQRAPAPSRARGQVSSLPPIPADLPMFDDDEGPERPTNLRMDADQLDWSLQEGESTGRFSTDGERFDHAPLGHQRDPFDSDPSIRTLPPAKKNPEAPSLPANDGGIYTTRPQPGTIGPISDHAQAMPSVLTATADIGDFEALKRYLAGNATVVHIPDLVGLLDTLESGLIEPIVVIDCKRPTVHITSVAALGEDLPRGTTVVLWGADEATWQQIDREKSTRCRWVRCSREASTADVGSLCSMLIG